MLAWPHSGFSADVGPAIAAADRAAVLRVARYGAHAPVAVSGHEGSTVVVILNCLRLPRGRR